MRQAGTITRLQIEVKATAIAPDTLSYLDSSIIYVTELAITPNTPIASGGEITLYSVSPALPAGLVLDPRTGIITGTPTMVTPPAVHTVTGSNSAGSVDAQLTIEVRAQVVPPTGLSYTNLALCTPSACRSCPTIRCTPVGEITEFSVSPTLPAGLSMDALTGVISGSPTAAQARTTFIVTGSNSSGSVTAQLAMTVASPRWASGLPADSMNVKRSQHTATLLRDGGFSSRRIQQSACPQPSCTTRLRMRGRSTGDLVDQRQSHTATRLANGKVLVAGGIQQRRREPRSPRPSCTIRLRDVVADRQHEPARDTHTATLLPNGKVLVAGG
jgi:hypothetical protein